MSSWHEREFRLAGDALGGPGEERSAAERAGTRADPNVVVAAPIELRGVAERQPRPRRQPALRRRPVFGDQHLFDTSVDRACERMTAREVVELIAGRDGSGDDGAIQPGGNDG